MGFWRQKDNDRKKRRAERGVLARPLDSLFFLLPLIVFYEVSTFFLQSSGVGGLNERVVALELIYVFFEVLGTTGVMLPGLAVVVILLVTHLVSREPWRFRANSVGLMYLESVAWAVPLVSLNFLSPIAAFRRLGYSYIGDVAMCIGAGIYEELIFRLVLVSALVVVGTDLMRFSQGSTLTAAVLLSAVVFAVHHHPPFGSDPFDAFRFTFRFAAGVYLGVIFVYRGYGPAAGAHIAYNMIVITLAV